MHRPQEKRLHEKPHLGLCGFQVKPFFTREIQQRHTVARSRRGFRNILAGPDRRGGGDVYAIIPGLLDRGVSVS